jgi:hypothetical protein
MEEIKKQKQVVMILSVLVFLIIGAVIALNLFYFQGIKPSQTFLAAPNSKLLNSQKEFKQIQDKLLQNEKFNELQKVGSWPLQVEAMTYGKDNPFNPNAIK